MLKGLGRDEVDDVLAERGSNVEIGCEFCGLQYHYDAVDIGALFSGKLAQAGGSGTMQ
jgi:molecular chaperone Hsp33